MKLEKKRALVSRALKIGKNRIVFNTQRLSDFKEAITKQDIRDLKESGAIIIKDKKGRRKIVKRKTRRRAGSVRKKVNSRKKDYVILTRKLRSHTRNLRTKDKITSEQHTKLRKEIRANIFRSIAHMKERIQNIGETK